MQYEKTDEDIFGVGVLTPEEAAQFTTVKAEKINETEEALRERNEKADKISRSGYDNTINMILFLSKFLTMINSKVFKFRNI